MCLYKMYVNEYAYYPRIHTDTENIVREIITRFPECSSFQIGTHTYIYTYYIVCILYNPGTRTIIVIIINSNNNNSNSNCVIMIKDIVKQSHCQGHH